MMTRLWKVVVDNSLLLVIGAVTALLWANLHHDSYERLSHSLHFIVNDIGMVFFFALATKEIFEATLPGGALASPREAAVPLLAAVGGMAAPAALYVIQVTLEGRPELIRGWAIPCATDIAFSYLAARFVFPSNHPAIPFLLLLAIADDALGLVLLALFYPSAPVSIFKLATFMIPALGLALWLKRRPTFSYWPYVVGAGGLSWLALHLGGVHPALALVPIVPFMPHEKRDLGIFHPRESTLPYTMNQFEHAAKVPVQFVLLLFGLVNAGVPVASAGGATWIVLVALVVGKPVGIVLMTFFSIKAGLRAPGGLSYLHTAVLGIAAGIGFTVALFFATAAFPPGPELDEAKMGALLSFIAAPLAVFVGRIAGLHPKKAYARPVPSRDEGPPGRR
jgi:NhaA family Na+:H+ antiporter